MRDLTAIMLIGGVTLALFGSVYVWSKDPRRRERAWELIQFMRCRDKSRLPIPRAQHAEPDRLVSGEDDFSG